MVFKAFSISDSTGITAESLGQSLLSRFGEVPVEQVTVPYINTVERAHAVVKRINASQERLGNPALVVMSIVNEELRDIVHGSNGLVLDMFAGFIEPMEQLFQQKAAMSPGSPFGVETSNYHNRIDAVNFVLDNDDGRNITNYNEADVIIIGLSRSGKTPTCLYLGMHFGIFAANCPFTEDELEGSSLPKSLAPFRKKLFGLLIDPDRLASIRRERYANSRYSSQQQCEFECRQFFAVLSRHKIPHLDSTHLSIEELSTRIMDEVGIERRILV